MTATIVSSVTVVLGSWSCKNGFACITARLSPRRLMAQDHYFPVCFTISPHNCDNGCCLFAVKIFLATPVVMSVRSCWVGCIVVNSNNVASALGVGIDVCGRLRLAKMVVFTCHH